MGVNTDNSEAPTGQADLSTPIMRHDPPIRYVPREVYDRMVNDNPASATTNLNENLQLNESEVNENTRSSEIDVIRELAEPYVSTTSEQASVGAVTDLSDVHLRSCKEDLSASSSTNDCIRQTTMDESVIQEKTSNKILHTAPSSGTVHSDDSFSQPVLSDSAVRTEGSVRQNETADSGMYQDSSPTASPVYSSSSFENSDEEFTVLHKSGDDTVFVEASNVGEYVNLVIYNAILISRTRFKLQYFFRSLAELYNIFSIIINKTF